MVQAGPRPGKSVQCSLDPEFAFFKCSSKVCKNNGKFDRALRVQQSSFDYIYFIFTWVLSMTIVLRVKIQNVPQSCC